MQPAIIFFKINLKIIKSMNLVISKSRGDVIGYNSYSFRLESRVLI